MNIHLYYGLKNTFLLSYLLNILRKQTFKNSLCMLCFWETCSNWFLRKFFWFVMGGGGATQYYQRCKTILRRLILFALFSSKVSYNPSHLSSFPSLYTNDIILIPPPKQLFFDKKGGGELFMILRYLLFSVKTGFWPNSRIALKSGN